MEWTDEGIRHLSFLPGPWEAEVLALRVARG